jgi:hypothetical protein
MSPGRLILLTIPALVACGGSSPATAPSLVGPALIDSIPISGANGVDRWTPSIRLTFSLPVGPAPTLSCACFPVAWSVSGNQVVGQVVSGSAPPTLGASCSISGQVAGVDGLLGPAFNVSFTVTSATTIIAADITAPTTLTAAGSPYLVDPTKVLYLNDAALTLEPGVDVEGSLKLLGSATVTAVGTANARIRVVNGGFASDAVLTSAHRFSFVDFIYADDAIVTSGPISIDHSTFTCGPSYPQASTVSIGSGSMTDSRMDGCAQIVSDAAVFERNVVLQPSYFLVIDPRYGSYASFSSFSNNYVDGYGSSGGLHNITVQDAGSFGLVRGNSFIGFGPKAITGSTSLSGAVDLSGNWWGTSDLASIASFLVDGTTESRFHFTFTVQPVLTAADPATPMP